VEWWPAASPILYLLAEIDRAFADSEWKTRDTTTIARAALVACNS
jgi:hypothetical protein